MPAIARHGDQCAQYLHPATASTVVASGTKVFADGKAVAKVGDHLSLHYHYIGSHWYPETPPSVFLIGSDKDFVEGKGVLRVGDVANCGCRIIAGSPDTNSE
jgi:uncharacterized Zn-binding protein involved in type VI secretion